MQYRNSRPLLESTEHTKEGTFEMDKTQVLEQIQKVGILPVLRAESAKQAIAISNAIKAGGITAMEVTMTVPGALDVIRQLVEQSGDSMLIGAGSVLDPETARACLLAGAAFIVSPALNLKTIEMCHRYGAAICPGALTPTEILTAWEAGADVVKVFPCSAVGGASYLKAVKAPMPQIRLIPTGGVSLATAESFLKAGAFALGVGGDLVNTKAKTDADFQEMTENARKYMAVVQQARKA
jgi:2-dehydro-3-deoxyphosphogluconate aldolase/(4S)-4-hydroxy-2-oxoglutarate aldolase